MAEAMLVSYLGERVPSLATAMDVLALADGALQPAEDLEVVRSTSQPIAPRLHLERVPRLLCRPGEYLQQTFGWGAADFDGAMLLRKLQLLLENLGVPAAIYESPAGRRRSRPSSLASGRQERVAAGTERRRQPAG